MGSKFFTRSMANYYWTENVHIGAVRAPRELPTEKEIELFKKHRNVPGTQLSVLFGDPASARETIQRFRNVGVDELILVIQAGMIPHELIMESIKTIGEEVIPYFK